MISLSFSDILLHYTPSTCHPPSSGRFVTILSRISWCCIEI
ncbi:hypothetical protein MITSMUL_03517 [Mitsuokella multacida DSM 20544]|uniref:Uncharacterized protein n=1 Tax=Mitsuokella multacida DSM 20544 TaxID=500635 RepID=C9KK18_9FIRM|nr:hypothetical protein MITSMUL_03517 [Mitsuokella multacida DSM 20544]